MKPYYQEAGITIYHADYRDVLPSLPPIGAVITSPPYNMGSSPWPHLGHWKPGDSAGGKSKWRNGSDASNGVQYRDYADAMPWDEYVAWQRDTLSLLWDRLPDAGSIFYVHKPRVIGAKLWTPQELLPAETILRQIVIWARPGGMNFNPTAFVPTHEWIMLLAKPAFRLRSKAVSGLGDVWRLTPDKNEHPAPFPLALPARILEAIPAVRIFDPFMGSGTTLKAAKDAGLEAIGADVSEWCCEEAAKRLRQEVFTFAAAGD